MYICRTEIHYCYYSKEPAINFVEVSNVVGVYML